MKISAFCLLSVWTIFFIKLLNYFYWVDSNTALATVSSKQVAQISSFNYPTFNSRQLDEQIARYQYYLSTIGKPDILIVGSSKALQGIDPFILQQALAQQGYPGLKIFNLGINGATAQVVNLLIQKFLTSEQLPQMILWADGARAFNGGRLDVTYNGIVASKGYRLLSTGSRPRNINKTQKFGFLPVERRFNPNTYYRRYPRVAGLYDSDYKDFNLRGKQTEALRAILNFTQKHDITLVFINLPLTDNYLDSKRQRCNQQFQKYMQRLALQNKFIFLNLSNFWVQRYNYFASPSHLNRYGAAAMSRLLAEDDRMPWQILNKP